MFKSLKIYQSQVIDISQLCHILIEFGYKRQTRLLEEGDFSQRGGILDIFPFSFECPIRIEVEFDKIHSIHSFDVENGKNLWLHQIVIILPFRKTQISRPENFSEESPINNFLELEKGDLVVHNNYGIAKFQGKDKIKVANNFKDHLILEYAGGDKLYVPFEQSNLVQRYVGFGGKYPKLYRLGSREWLRVKERVKKGTQVLALELLQIQALRTSLSGFAFSKDTDWQRDFEKSFPFQETKDQTKATEETKKDMESIFPMDRLLCGDVGYGKTEVAMRAAFKAVMDNKQVAILVPTTILAEQHFYNFQNRIKNFPINVEMLSRFKTKNKQLEIIKGLQTGSVDIVIATHRLLSTDIKFKDLGLLVIDEEQRFGVKHKEKLKHLRLTVDVLTLTATPIPRTLYMSLMGAKDMSTINTPPSNRIPVKTIVTEFDKDLIHQAILREIKRQGQVFFLHNRVEDIEKVMLKLQKLNTKARIGLAHGQMATHNLEKIMLAFLKGEIDVLVCTTIIESGIDVPNANTLIVDDAHTFGLADLHQLRGRVGRFNRQAYAYFLVPNSQVLSQEAKKRLEALQEFSELGSGFKIAFEDLQIRGAGNLLGVEQHGFIWAVGFDLYCRLLRQAVYKLKYLKGKKLNG
ncbi:MAG: transcription-repair coupling factor [Candidatus Omnitrophota bacterium]|nr:transcription-repair coupling factor [Candidatus Omnitrophota bacterium]